ncbi:hypothetical protein AOLI_G00011810 [Acnodon oligacanthus]
MQMLSSHLQRCTRCQWLTTSLDLGGRCSCAGLGQKTLCECLLHVSASETRSYCPLYELLNELQAAHQPVSGSSCAHPANTVIRKFQPSDHEAVTATFRNGTQEHIIPSFTHAISQPLHITVTLCFFTVGYILGGGSVVLGLLAGGFWVGLLYYCCYGLYAGFVRLKLNTDMRDIAGFYLSSPDNCFFFFFLQ